jgi:hypothetical protein
MSRQFALNVGTCTVTAELLEDQAPTVAEQFWKVLPLESFAIHAKFAGGEMIVMVPFYSDAEHEVLNVQPGDIGYFPDMQTICIFYDDVTPFGYVSVFARITDGLAKLKPVARSLTEQVSMPVTVKRLQEGGQA